MDISVISIVGRLYETRTRLLEVLFIENALEVLINAFGVFAKSSKWSAFQLCGETGDFSESVFQVGHNRDMLSVEQLAIVGLPFSGHGTSERNVAFTIKTICKNKESQPSGRQVCV